MFNCLIPSELCRHLGMQAHRRSSPNPCLRRRWMHSLPHSHHLARSTAWLLRTPWQAFLPQPLLPPPSRMASDQEVLQRPVLPLPSKMASDHVLLHRPVLPLPSQMPSHQLKESPPPSFRHLASVSRARRARWALQVPSARSALFCRALQVLRKRGWVPARVMPDCRASLTQRRYANPLDLGFRIGRQGLI